MHVNVNIHVRAIQFAVFIFLDQSKLGQYCGILMHAAHAARDPACQFAHAAGTAVLQGAYQRPPAFRQASKKFARRFEVERFALVALAGQSAL